MTNDRERLGYLVAAIADDLDEEGHLSWYLRDAENMRRDVYALEAGAATPMDQIRVADRLRLLAVVVERAEERHRKEKAGL